MEVTLTFSSPLAETHFSRSATNKPTPAEKPANPHGFSSPHPSWWVVHTLTAMNNNASNPARVQAPPSTEPRSFGSSAVAGPVAISNPPTHQPLASLRSSGRETHDTIA